MEQRCGYITASHTMSLRACFDNDEPTNGERGLETKDGEWADASRLPLTSTPEVTSEDRETASRRNYQVEELIYWPVLNHVQ